MRLYATILLFFLLVPKLLIAQSSFPDSWAGTYKGELQIYGVDSTRMKIAMQLDITAIQKDSVYDWKLTYDFNGTKDVRAYELHVVDTNKGHYQIDEKNSIILDAFLHTNTLTSFFSLIDSYIIASYTKEQDTIVFEIISGKYESIAATGSTEHEGENIPEVKSYLVNGRQRAVLTKVE
ncbi:MAG: hypothetical protein KDC74_02575 [Flavobacteriaceae bacterium]|nr:hypothetical protein [Flavobacteriaceae bacterium]